MSVEVPTYVSEFRVGLESDLHRDGRDHVFWKQEPGVVSVYYLVLCVSCLMLSAQCLMFGVWCLVFSFC